MPGYVRAAQRREQLLTSAREVLVRDGLASLTLRAVAAEAGVHLGTLQYIFRSRAELVEALVDRVLSEARFGQFEPGDGGLAEELGRLVDWFVTQFLDDDAMLELLRDRYVTAISPVHPQAPGRGAAALRVIPADHAELIALIGRRSGEAYSRSPQDLGRLWGVGLAGLFYDYLADRDADRFRVDGGLLIDAVVGVARPVRATT